MFDGLIQQLRPRTLDEQKVVLKRLLWHMRREQLALFDNATLLQFFVQVSTRHTERGEQ